MWFHMLAYLGQCLTDSHLDIIFYYLWKKGKYAKELKVKFTTTDCLFNKIINTLYEKFLAKKKDHSLITAQHAIAIISEILARLNVEEMRMYMYNSFSTVMKDSTAMKACQPFSVLLPYFFALFDEFIKDNKPVSLDPFDVVKVDGLPQQNLNDCGFFVASFAEYVIDKKPIPSIYDVEKQCDRLIVLFFKYARMKEFVLVMSLLFLAKGLIV
ncbi:hypothetical protein G4B88_031339 [Cannabis sativa]|uniref:Ubiquitin-like protease family profile domain-containing protein n=1 Tax=Cannabis sativa TaxID=3483 RepID=A0A7J6FJZ3_CANSA|nr:hypothetical protein G4B88_031339 [Cannabis sativa]